ncbi:tetratricopeptide repeat protein [Tolypothrix sp. PCC 7910]|uniref:tetratricopeptide repeat protein n=1 Tax=Tolypothrix sp. PCC 7910 TaxID=2099387 RepID=UPI00142776AA|nr:tetratricopeptide repeat protein [Tolypothrix sp. PCC 7910]QIR36872.1 tetratricopeptide repeat protein [Tolypothrix sp. PCC 7910]
MPLKSELLKFLSRIPNTQTVPQRKALLAAVGFDRLGRQITWEGTNLVFFNELLELLYSEGQIDLACFLRNLADRDLNLVGLDDSHKLNTFAEKVGNLTSQEWDREFWGISDTKAPSHVPFFLPQSDTPNFTGREEQLQQLEALLLNSHGSKVCSIVGVLGAGGIGKSALACHFATIHQDKFPDGVIGLRVDGKDLDTIAREFVRRCGEELDSEDERDTATLMREVFAHRQMLLIFDNAEEANIKKLRPGGNRCAVIVTTRRRNLPFSLDIGEQETIDLPPLPEADALKLLKKILGSERVENAVAATKRLVKLVGNLPLALQVLGAALRGQREPLDDYTKALEEEKDELFEELKIESDRDLNVEFSLSLSLKSLSKDEVDFFACLSVCAAEGFTKQTAMATTGWERNLQAQRCLKKLYDLSLLNYVDTGENRFVLHPLVRMYAEALARKRGLLPLAQERHAKFFVEWLQSDELTDETTIAEVAANLDDVILAAEWLQTHEADTAQSKKNTYEFALKLQPLFEQYGYWQKAITLMARFQSWAEQFEDWNAVVRYKMHEARYWSFAEEFERAEEILKSLQTNLQKIEDLDLQKRREAKVLNVLGGVFHKQGKTEEAIQTFTDEILIEEEIGDDRSLAIVYNRLGKLFQSQGKLEEAQHTFERGIAIAEILNNQSSLAIGLNCLGGLLQQQGKLEEAQQTFEREIEIDKALNDQSQLAITLNRLGGILQQQGKLEEAQHAFERQIAIAEALNDQSQLAIGLNCLGGLLQQQGKLEEAQHTFERQIAITEAFNDQSQLAIGLNCLGGVLQRQGKLEEAQHAFERQIAIAEALNDQSSFAIGLNRLGGLLQQQGKLEQAQHAFERGIAITEALNDQSSLAIGLNRLGGLLQQQGKLEQAQHTFERQIAITEAFNDQSQLAIGLNCLGGVLQRQGKLEEAQHAFERQIAIAEALNDQSQLAIGLNRLGGLLQQQGKLEQALHIFEREIAIDEALNDQSQLAIGLNRLGGVLQQQGKLEEAQHTFERQIAIYETLNDQSRLVIGLNRLGGVLQQQGKLEEAQHIFEREIAIYETLNDQSQLAIGLNCLGGLLQQQGKLEEAQHIFEREIAIYETLNDLSSRYAWALHNLGRVWKSKGEFEKAEILLKQSQEVFEDEKDLSGLAKVMNTLGGVLERQQKWDEAEKILRQSYDLAVKLEDKQGQAIIANSLGQVMAHQEGEKAFELSQMYFRKSIELGEELNEQKHLAKVHTAMGQAFLAHEVFEQAVEALSKGFEIDESLSNTRGLRIVTPNLTYALSQLKKQEEALKYCERALKIAPNYPGFLQLRDKIQAVISTGIQKTLIKTGLILYIGHNEDNSRWGQIAPDDGSPNITFNEKFIGSKSISTLTQGVMVEVEVKEKYGKLYARQIRVIEEEED